ncbi:MAG: glycosyltransferase family 4 protein, partial [Bacteroides sp.]|nr:glycosyltransferase family 4 protein [Bacteroides sp.]
MHTLIIPMYYPEKDSAPHRGYMFTEQATELAKAGHKVGLLFVEQRPLKKFSIVRFFKESHYQISETSDSGFTTMRMHAWNSKLSTKLGAMVWVLLTIIL